MKKIDIILGTRPEAIKLAPVISTLKRDRDFHTGVVVTAQHRHMLDQVFDVFKLTADIDLNLMRDNQTLAHVTSRAVEMLDVVVKERKPDCVIVQGDTTTAFAAALTAYYNRIPVAHVEAGLRTFQKYQPFPEEMNRLLISQLADLHFAPTAGAKSNLLREGTPSDRIFVTGNTGIDALLTVAAGDVSAPATAVHKDLLRNNERLLLVTAHRRENHGVGLETICAALLRIAEDFEDVKILIPVHPNPNVRGVVGQLRKHHRIILTEPMDYVTTVSALRQSYMVLTDSGGLQEEAPSLGKPVLVMRNTTDRPEAVHAGVVRIVGTDPERIYSEAAALLTDPRVYRKMSRVSRVYGDGHASQRIAGILRRVLLGDSGAAVEEFVSDS